MTWAEVKLDKLSSGKALVQDQNAQESGLDAQLDPIFLSSHGSTDQDIHLLPGNMLILPFILPQPLLMMCRDYYQHQLRLHKLSFRPTPLPKRLSLQKPLFLQYHWQTTVYSTTYLLFQATLIQGRAVLAIYWQATCSCHKLALQNGRYLLSHLTETCMPYLQAPRSLSRSVSHNVLGYSIH